MSLFEYVVVLISVVLSLGIARLLESHAQLLKRGRKVRWSPTYLLWLLIIFANHVDLWASLWMVRDAPSWTLPSLVSVLLAAVALFYAAVLSAPDLEPDQPIDLWQFHMDNRARYVGAAAAYMLLGAILNMTVLVGHFDLATFTGTLPGLGLALAAIFIRNRWAQILIPIVIGVLMTIYFVTYFSALQA